MPTYKNPFFLSSGINQLITLFFLSNIHIHFFYIHRQHSFFVVNLFDYYCFICPLISENKVVKTLLINSIINKSSSSSSAYFRIKHKITFSKLIRLTFCILYILTFCTQNIKFNQHFGEFPYFHIKT